MTEVEKQLFNIFSNFIRDLSKTYPEIKNCLYRNYENILLNESDYELSNYPKLENFLKILQENEKYITEKNLEFFDLEIELLEEISFKKLWEKNISNKTRESIWKYLQTFQIININLQSNQQLKEALNQIGTETIMEVDKKTAKDLKNLKKLSENVTKEEKEEQEFDDMFEGLLDTNIGSIAKEVAENLNLDEMLGDINENSNPTDIMGKLMNPEKMGNIFNSINQVMENKMSNGELSDNDLKNEAQNMMNQMGNNSLFKNMMEQMNPNQTDTDNTELTKEEKKQKLKEKIKEKRNNR